MSIENKSRDEIIDELIEYELDVIRSISYEEFDKWVRSCMRVGLQGYEELADDELALMYMALLGEQDKQIAEGGE